MCCLMFPFQVPDPSSSRTRAPLRIGELFIPVSHARSPSHGLHTHAHTRARTLAGMHEHRLYALRVFFACHRSRVLPSSQGGTSFWVHVIRIYVRGICFDIFFSFFPDLVFWLFLFCIIIARSLLASRQFLLSGLEAGESCRGWRFALGRLTPFFFPSGGDECTTLSVNGERFFFFSGEGAKGRTGTEASTDCPLACSQGKCMTIADDPRLVSHPECFLPLFSLSLMPTPATFSISTFFFCIVPDFCSFPSPPFGPSYDSDECAA